MKYSLPLQVLGKKEVLGHTQPLKVEEWGKERGLVEERGEEEGLARAVPPTLLPPPTTLGRKNLLEIRLY